MIVWKNFSVLFEPPDKGGGMEIDMKSDRDKPNSGVFKKTEKINWKYMILAFASIAITCILLFAGLKVLQKCPHEKPAGSAAAYGENHKPEHQGWYG